MTGSRASEELAGKPWVIVAGDFHRQGGMDRANAELATYLVEQKIPVHLVGHRVDRALAEHPLVATHPVPRPGGVHLFNDWFLESFGRRVAERVTSEWPGARVLVNGGNCCWADLNWVHCVHHAWPCVDHDAPNWFKLKNRLAKASARRREHRALRTARLVIANSERTRRDLLDHLRLDENQVKRVYLGIDSTCHSVTERERRAARDWLKVPESVPVIVFVGALGYDQNKGLDTLWSAWQQLCLQRDWDARLIVAGGGRAVERWRVRIAQTGLSGQIQMLGFSDRIGDLLAAADLLVSPVRYEAYGLNVQEAVCRGVSALVSSQAGVAEHYSSELREMLLSDPEDADELASRLWSWRARIDFWKDCFRPLGQKLRNHTWSRMAEQIMTLAEEHPRSPINNPAP